MNKFVSGRRRTSEDQMYRRTKCLRVQNIYNLITYSFFFFLLQSVRALNSNCHVRNQVTLLSIKLHWIALKITAYLISSTVCLAGKWDSIFASKLYSHCQSCRARRQDATCSRMLTVTSLVLISALHHTATQKICF